MIDATQFRQGMSFLTGAVSVVTTSGVSGRYGFTASAVCSVSDSPPTLLVCINRASASHPHFVQNGLLAVNVLSVQQQPLAIAFSSVKAPEQRFQEGVWLQLETGAPVLADALASFDCRIVSNHEIGTHDVFICHVVAVHQSDQIDQSRGLVYFKRGYFEVGSVGQGCDKVSILSRPLVTSVAR